MNATMPSKKKQFNIRIDEWTEAEMRRLQKVLSEKLGLDLSLADVLKLSVRALSKENPPTPKKPKA